MGEALLQQLKRRFGYEQWFNRNTLAENLFIWKFFFSGNEFPDWQPHRLQQVKAPQLPSVSKAILKPSEGPAALKSASLAESPLIKRRAEPLVSADTFECRSRAAAHEFLVRLLGEFQVPVAFSQQNPIGDVSFVAPGGVVVAFARANLVHLIRNAGPAAVDLTELASHFDASLSRKPEPEVAHAEAFSETRRFSARPEPRTHRAGELIPLVVEAAGPRVAAGRFASAAAEAAELAVEVAAPEPPPVFYKVFYREGEVLEEPEEREQLFYQCSTPGRQEVTVYAIDQSGAAVRQDLEVSLE